MLTPDDIRWLTPSEAARTAQQAAPRCAVCGAKGQHAAILQAPSMSRPEVTLTLFRCGTCESLYYDPPDITSFSEFAQDPDVSLRHYVELGCGVWETIWPAIAERHGAASTMLEVGCGYGFSVDFWRRMVGGEAVGVELADYGQDGARALDTTVYNEPLEQCAALRGRRFELVYASEVVEHVPDPIAFTSLLARFVADEGILVLTTPCAEFIAPQNHSTTLLAALAPGFHGFLLSCQALADVAKRCGFAHVEVRVFGERQILWASHRRLKVEPRRSEAHGIYVDYLGRRLPTLTRGSAVWQGLAYRYCKHLVNTGRVSEARPVGLELLTELQTRYGSEIADPTSVLVRLRACNTLRDYGCVAPYFLPCFYYLLGALAQHGDRDDEQALRYYAGAVDCTIESSRLGSVYFLEPISLLWLARLRQAEILFASGNHSSGADILVTIADQGDRCDSLNAFALAPRELLEIKIPICCERLWERGRRSDAEKLFDVHRRYLLRKYGPKVVSATEVGSLLAAKSQELPLEPLFAPYFVARTSKGSEAITGLTEVKRIAETYAADAAYGKTLRRYANRAGKLLAAIGAGNHDSANWSFEIAYRARPKED